MDSIAGFLKGLVCEALRTSLTALFGYAYQGMSDTTDTLTITPATWQDGRIYTFIEAIHENIMIPVAAVIIIFVLTAEIYNIVIEKNQMKEIDISALVTLFMKIIICFVIVINSLKLVNGLFELGNWVTGKTVDIVPIGIGTPQNLADQIVTALENDKNVKFWAVLDFWLAVTLFTWVFIIINAIAFVIVYVRLMQMVLYASFGPVPLATFLNKDWSVGQNYIKNLMALSFQGFLIILIYGIYTILISTPPSFDAGEIASVQKYIIEHLFYSVLLVMSLTKTNTITQSIFGAH